MLPSRLPHHCCPALCRGHHFDPRLSWGKTDGKSCKRAASKYDTRLRTASRGRSTVHAAAPAAAADASARCCACSAAASCCASNRRVPHSLLAASASSASPRVASCGSAAGQAGRGVCVPSDAAPRRRRAGPSCRPQGAEGVAVGCAHAAAQPASQLATGQRAEHARRCRHAQRRRLAQGCCRKEGPVGAPWAPAPAAGSPPPPGPRTAAPAAPAGWAALPADAPRTPGGLAPEAAGQRGRAAGVMPPPPGSAAQRAQRAGKARSPAAPCAAATAGAGLPGGTRAAVPAA